MQPQHRRSQTRRPKESAGIPFDSARWVRLPHALWQTWREAALRPGAFFARVPESPAVARPLAYAVLLMGIAVLLSWVQQPLIGRIFDPLPYRWRILGDLFRTTPEFRVAAVALTPLAALALAGVYHLLLLVAGARTQFRTTLRGVCYSYTTFALWAVPVLGWVLHPWAWAALLIVGLARAHRLPAWCSAFAVLLPAVAACAFLASVLLRLAAVIVRGVPAV